MFTPYISLNPTTKQTKKSKQSRGLLLFSLHAKTNTVSEQAVVIMSQLYKGRKLVDVFITNFNKICFT